MTYSRMRASARKAVKSRPFLLSAWSFFSRAVRNRHINGPWLVVLGAALGGILGASVGLAPTILTTSILFFALVAASLMLPRRPTLFPWVEDTGWVGDIRTVKEPIRVARALIVRGFELDAAKLLDEREAWTELGSSYLRSVWRSARDNGQIITSLRAIGVVAERTDSHADIQIRDRLEAEIKVMNGTTLELANDESESIDVVPDSVLHVVGKTILSNQNGYTIRTHEICRAQADLGLDVSVVGQMGLFETHGLENWNERKDGVAYYVFRGPLRNEIPLDAWLRQSVENLHAIVRKIRPAVIHAHSDFLNALIASATAERFNIPLVYEVRGFWEETLLTNLSQRNAWPSVDEHVNRHGLPEAYTLRRQIEQRVRDRADAIVTLDEAMADQIRSSSAEEKKIVLAPNSLRLPDQSENGLQREELKNLRVKLGFPDDAIIVGIASSLVPYEGVEVLIDAVSVLQNKNLNTTVGLLIIGDGVARQELERRAKNADLSHTIFTGQIPNRSVYQYVALLDIAVFPRISTPVTERVQPLKPIEALGMGCSVVVSSVAPLNRLADETQLIRVFKSGDAASLATELSELVSSATTRATLAEKGKRWVRENRTWSKNAEVYAELYEALNNTGVSGNEYPPRANDHESNHNQAPDRNSSLPLEKFIRMSNISDNADVPPSYFEYGRFPSIDLSNLDWYKTAIDNRTLGWYLHAWDFMDGTLRRFEEERRQDLLQWCWGLSESWFDSFGDGNPQGTMAFYDMAIAQRSVRLGFLVQQLLTFKNLSQAQTHHMMASVEFHAGLLSDPKRFSGWNNHGLYTACAGLSLSRRFPTAPWSRRLRNESQRRVEGLVSQQFLPDGGHVEHSFDYHRMILESITQAIDDGLLELDLTRFPLDAAKEALNWMIRPDGLLEQVGDSPQTGMTLAREESILSRWSPKGEPSADQLAEDLERVKILPETGFLFIRDRSRSAENTKASESYLTFSGSFHSRAHKHADDLSITWFDLGREILIDAGRYGYGMHLDKLDPLRKTHGFYYDSEERQYVESTIAHNTVEADGKLHDRVIRKPYGGADFEYHDQDGVHFASAEVSHDVWSHRRKIWLNPGSDLQIEDELTSNDSRPHLFTQWFNLPGNLKLCLATSRLVVFKDPEGGRVTFENKGKVRLVAPARGVREPQIRGFRSRQDTEFTPSWNFAFELVGSREIIKTAIMLGADSGWRDDAGP